jgi:tetratricopeptide (TPR) repeat protein
VRLVDRRNGSCVSMRVGKVLIAGMVSVAVAACGGAPKKDTASAKKSDGTVTYDDTGSIYAADEAMPLTPEPKPTGETAPTAEAPEPRSDLPRPPTQDLPKERRDALVKEHLKQGVAALRAKDADGIIRAARSALDVDESNVEAMIMLAHGNYLKGYDDKAEAVLNIARKQRAGDAHPVLWMLLGLVYDRTNREDQALAAYERATQLKPDYLAALTNRGAIYLKRKRYADAIQVLEQVVQIHPKSPRAHTHLGAAYRGRSADLVEQKAQRDQLLKRAEQELRLAISQDPAYAPAYFNMGILYLDADPFPGIDTLPRLLQAQKFLSDYKKTAGPAGVPVVDEYLAAAAKGIEREQKILDRKRKKDAEKRKGGGT